MDLSPPERLRIRWLVLTSVSGAVLVALAIVSDIAWEWENILPSVFLEGGVALGLVAALFLLERQFIEKVRGVIEGTCTLADPPAPITKGVTFGGGILWGCKHNPQHRWDESGSRGPDYERPSTDGPRLPEPGEL